jgi:hypothetical protein
MEWKGATGRVRGGALLSKDAQSCVSPPNDPGEGYLLGAGVVRLLQSPPYSGGVGTVGKVTRRDDLSGLLVAVLDRGSVFPIRRAIRRNGLDKR